MIFPYGLWFCFDILVVVGVCVCASVCVCAYIFPNSILILNGMALQWPRSFFGVLSTGFAIIYFCNEIENLLYREFFGIFAAFWIQLVLLYENEGRIIFSDILRVCFCSIISTAVVNHRPRCSCLLFCSFSFAHFQFTHKQFSWLLYIDF